MDRFFRSRAELILSLVPQRGTGSDDEEEIEEEEAVDWSEIIDSWN